MPEGSKRGSHRKRDTLGILDEERGSYPWVSPVLSLGASLRHTRRCRDDAQSSGKVRDVPGKQEWCMGGKTVSTPYLPGWYVGRLPTYLPGTTIVGRRICAEVPTMGGGPGWVRTVLNLSS